MTYEMAMMMNWLLVAAGLLATDLFSGFFDGDGDTSSEPEGTNEVLSSGDDTFDGTTGNDTILGLAGNDILDGLEGSDRIEGNIGNDSIAGGEGNDFLAGGGDTDTISGGAGNDVLSSDRLDDAADWTRGDTELLSGGQGNDMLFFAGEDIATGGEGEDSFGVIDSGEDPALITDFEVGVDDITLYVDGLNEATTPPILSYATDANTNITTVSLDGTAVLQLNGIFTPEELAVTLDDVDDIDFNLPNTS